MHFYSLTAIGNAYQNCNGDGTRDKRYDLGFGQRTTGMTYAKGEGEAQLRLEKGKGKAQLRLEEEGFITSLDRGA